MCLSFKRLFDGLGPDEAIEDAKLAGTFNIRSWRATTNYKLYNKVLT